jgi:hypothetical protein
VEYNPRIVVMVKEGTWGQVSQEDAHSYLDMVAGLLRKPTREHPQTKEQVPVAVVEIVDTAEDADRRIANGHPHVDVVVFNSRSMLRTARELNRASWDAPQGSGHERRWDGRRGSRDRGQGLAWCGVYAADPTLTEKERDHE